MASWSFVVVWAVAWVWAGRGLLARICWAADCRALVCGVVGLSGDWCRKHACHASASCLCGECGVVGAPCVLGVRGGGMLSGFWGSAPWLPGLSGAPGCWGFWVGVGGLVVNCIVDASILL